MTIFQLTRMRRLQLIALYLQTQPGYAAKTGPDAVFHAAGVMTREQLVAAIVGTPGGKRLLRSST